MREPEAPGDIDAVVLELLNKQLRLPTRFVERRVDRLVDLSRYSAHWRVSMQVRLPEIESRVSSSRPVLISLGIFEKKRLPDLEVIDGEGRILPTIRRADRTRALALLLLQDVVRHATETGTASPSNEALQELASQLRQVIAATSTTADRLFDDYSARVASVFGESAVAAAHLDAARAFVTFTHVFVWVDASPGGRVMLTYTYTERHTHPVLLASLRDGSLTLQQRLRMTGRYVAMRLGLLAVPIRMRLNGANHAHSYYLMVAPPAGTEVEALYWRTLAPRPAADGGDGIDSASFLHESSDYLLACYHQDHDAGGGRASVDLRIHSAGLRLVWLMTGLLFGVGVLGVVRDRAQLHDAISLLAFIPGGLLALITQRNSEFEYRMSEIIKRVCLLLVLLAALFGIAVSGDFVAGGHGLVSDRHLSIALAVYAAPVFVLFTYIAFRRSGPSERQAGHAALLQWSELSAYRTARRRNSYATMAACAIAAVSTLFALSNVHDAGSSSRSRVRRPQTQAIPSTHAPNSSPSATTRTTRRADG